MLSQEVVSFIAQRILGEGEERKTALDLIKKEPKKITQWLSPQMFDLTAVACFELGGVVVVQDTGAAAKQVIDYCSQLADSELVKAPA